jgi:transcriptional regulator with XRE-family HTH domain
MSQRDLAAIVGVGNASMSRIESGQTRPSSADLARIITAVGNGDRLEELARAAVTAELGITPGIMQQPVNVRQALVRADEELAGTIRVFQADVVPGLLQTSHYARRLLRLSRAGDKLEEAVQERLRRQEILGSGREFEFVITENALRWNPAPGPGDVPMPHLLRQQIRHIASAGTQPNITLRVIPSSAPMLLVPPGSFLMHENRAGGRPDKVIVELPSERLELEAGDDVAAFRNELELLRPSGLTGEGAARYLGHIAETLGKGHE